MDMDMEMEIGEEINGKRQRELDDAKVYVKKGKTAAEEESDAIDKMVEWLMLEQDAVEELGDLLDLSEQAAASMEKPVKFVDDPYLSPVVFQSSAAYVTINGNEEMCGSSFSDSESSVMASIDTGGLVRRRLNVDGGGEEGEGAAGRWLNGRDFVEGIFVQSLSDRDLFGTPPPPLGCNLENNATGGGGGAGGGGDGEEEMWMSFVDDLFGDSR